MSQSTHAPRRLAVLLIAAPVVIAAGWLAWFEITLDPPRSSPGPASSLTSALEQDLIIQAFAHIRSGEDPNAPMAFRDDQLTGGDELMATPLLIAVAYNRSDSVSMLMSSGARLDAPGNRFSVCLARRMGHGDLAGMIVREGGAEETCPETAHSEEAPLRGYVE